MEVEFFYSVLYLLYDCFYLLLRIILEYYLLLRIISFILNINEIFEGKYVTCQFLYIYIFLLHRVFLN